ncbi:MAG TPA: ABC transporter permease [Candidatus Nanopelagicaceae bacterium]
MSSDSAKMAEVSIEAPRPKRSRKQITLKILSRYGTLIGLFGMIVAFTIKAPSTFPTLSNFTNILSQSSLTVIIASGLTMTLVVGEFDLSIGYVASFLGLIVAGLLAHNKLPILVAMIAVLLLGSLIGTVNGVLVAKAKINAVIATLGVGTALVGVGFAYSTYPIVSGVPPSFSNIALGSLVFGIPNLISIMIVVCTILWIVLNKTDLGQKMQAVGGNIEAAKLSGIRVDRVKIFAFAIAGICAALTGALLASLLGSGTLAAADGYLLDSFAAVFLGSATLRDGEFHIVGTLIGALIINIGFNGLSIFGAPTYFQQIFQGGILVLAVGLSTISRKYSKT